MTVETKINYIDEFRAKARNKNITVRDVVMRCAYKAARAKGENKEEIYLGLLRKAFSPALPGHRPHPYYTVFLVNRDVNYTLKWGKTPASIEPEDVVAMQQLTQSFNYQEL